MVTRDLFIQNYGLDDLLTNEANIDEFPYKHSLSYASEATLENLLKIPGKVVVQTSTKTRATVVMRFEDPYGIVNMQVSGGFFTAMVLSDSSEGILKLVDYLSAVPHSELDSDEINATFWTYGPHGPEATSRKIVAPLWADIEGNYTATTRDALEKMLALELNPTTGGKLVLWHGVPGTGKTYALRMWARAWRDTLDLHYIVDPEVFFGDKPAYMVKVLLGDGDTSKWRLIVAEDTGELLAKDAKRATGQSLSRLLNVCDGLLGQGLKVLVLVSTNEDLGALHGAVTRPGRCIANVGFDLLTAAESAEWMRARGISKDFTNSNTVAELYSEKLVTGPIVTSRDKQPVGFASGRK